MDYIEEKMEALDELLRKAYNIIHPESNVKWYLNRGTRTSLMRKHPKCFFVVQNKIGRDVPFPICNMSGMVDPTMIKFSLALAQRFKDKPEVDTDRLDTDRLEKLIMRLKAVHARHDKEVPTPAPAAAKKANVTKNFNSVSKYLKGIN